MKTRVFLLYLFLLSSFTYPQWNLLNPYPTGNALKTIHFIDDNTGWAAGVNGTIIKTTNKGNVWSFQSSGSTNLINSIFFPDIYVGCAAGADGLIIRTSDGGEQWNIINSGTSAELKSIMFFNRLMGWAVGKSGVITRTTDSGLTWNVQQSNLNSDLYSVFFIDDSTGWISGESGLILQTTDSGVSWVQQNSGITYQLYSLFFSNNQTGWAAGLNSILKTTNGGSTWVKQYYFDNPPGVIRSFSDIHFQNNFGWAVGSRSLFSGYAGICFITTDAGQTWTESFMSAEPHATSFAGETGWISGDAGMLAITTDNGISWQENSIIRRRLDNIVSNENTLFAGGYGSLLYRSSDSGLNWHSVNYVFSGYIEGITFPSQETGYLVDNYQYQNGKVYKTTDGGESWNQLWSLPSGLPIPPIFKDVAFSDPENGYIVGYQGILLKTTNGGMNWNYLSDVTSSSLFGVYFIENTGWIIGTSGYIGKTSDAGLTWSSQNSGTASTLYSIYMLNESTGWISGAGGVVLKTTDSGASWITQQSGVQFGLEKIFFIDENHGWMAGQEILHTTDGGLNWQVQAKPDGSQNLYSLFFRNNYEGWAVGDNGTILYTSNGGVTFVESESETPEEFLLAQNYPNPFNPKTTIHYDVKNSGRVQLKVYDLLGNEVSTLIDQHKEIGTYSVNFDATNLSSGVYIYTITVNEFNQSKKMVLIK
jgi:photosystem II stability/assembly factor-like uncharacterized protein